jgi:hypothetical protein
VWTVVCVCGVRGAVVYPGDAAICRFRCRFRTLATGACSHTAAAPRPFRPNASSRYSADTRAARCLPIYSHTGTARARTAPLGTVVGDQSTRETPPDSLHLGLFAINARDTTRSCDAGSPGASSFALRQTSRTRQTRGSSTTASEGRGVAAGVREASKSMRIER